MNAENDRRILGWAKFAGVLGAMYILTGGRNPSVFASQGCKSRRAGRASERILIVSGYLS